MIEWGYAVDVWGMSCTKVYSKFTRFNYDSVRICDLSKTCDDCMRAYDECKNVCDDCVRVYFEFGKSRW